MLTALNKKLLLSCCLLSLAFASFTQIPSRTLNARNAVRCATMERMNEAIKNDPSLRERWKAEGERQYNAYLQRKEIAKEADISEIIIPVVFHLIDTAEAQSWITDRDIYEQIEILNQAYNGEKAEMYKNVIPSEMYKRVGNIPIKFVLARRTPSGALTSGIERRTNETPDRIKIKSTADGGLDAWDVNKYLNVWCGTFTGGDDGLLGIATFPFTTTEGPQGVVISIATLPYASNVSRSYYPSYSEGATLAHEIGHYLYLWHTFGDDTVCNNDDFREEAGWPLPNGAGPEGDDTPEEKGGPDNAIFGNPSQNYSDGCATQSFGEMYGSFMNYFDDRALFMFSDGMRKRVEGCINLYRPGLKTSKGATPPVAVNDAFLVTVNPRGIPERREYITNNTPLTATVRNTGTSNLTKITLNVKLDAAAATTSDFTVNLAPGSETTLSLGNINAAAGTHALTIYTSSPNNGTDRFTNNDTIRSFFYMNTATVNAPFKENFSGNTFPPAGWQIWNPQSNTTWTKSTASGFSLEGSATVQNFDYDGDGQLDDLVSPSINMGLYDSSILSFRVAYAVYDTVDVSLWDGLEVYVSGNGGASYQLAYKKSGKQLRTITSPLKTSFAALTTQPSRWRLESINLTPYIKPGKNLLFKIRNVNAYGNNTYIDDINVSAFITVDRDAFPISILNFPDLLCEGATPAPSITFGTTGKLPLTSLKINYAVDNGSVNTVNWTGLLARGQNATIALPPLTGLANGSHTLTVFTSNPNGLSDEFTVNDTIKKAFHVFGKVSLPISEDFEGNIFPPATWGISNPDAGITWEKTTTAAKTGSGSMLIRNFDYTFINTTDKFVSSVVSETSGYDSLFVTFDYAYSIGTIATLPDTLELQITSNCNQSVTTIWKKWGTELQTLADPNNATGAKFTPMPGEWRNVKIYLTPIVGIDDFQVNFVAKSNRQNNLYVDNINIYGKTLPARLKQQGYLFYPSPFKQQFIIRNYEVPTDLKSASIYNSTGQLVWQKKYNGDAYTEMPVDLGAMAAGIYIVKLQYTNKQVVDKIVKQ